MLHLLRDVLQDGVCDGAEASEFAASVVGQASGRRPNDPRSSRRWCQEEPGRFRSSCPLQARVSFSDMFAHRILSIHRSSSRRSSSTLISWCRATLFRMLDSVLILMGLCRGITS